MKSVALITIGCKLNQFETEQMRESFEARGFKVSGQDEKADIYVINTCTVTSKSDYRSRQAIRRALRHNPDATIIVTGCYAQVAPHEVASIKGIDAILGNSRKCEVADYADLPKQSKPMIAVDQLRREFTAGGDRRIHTFGSYTRAFVKIQDGCDNRCTYCAVPAARGPSRSKPCRTILEEIATLVDHGYKEIVLTGVHLGSYGKDLDEDLNLAALLRKLSRVDGLERIRLSSVEPTDFTPELIDTIADPVYRVCPHVHVPLQSGDNRILRLMGRNYTRDFYADIVETIASRVPRCGIGADVMVGFPGEDDRAFSNTFGLVADLPITYLHVFAFSPRPNTVASSMAEQVEAYLKKERSKQLRQLGKAKNRAFRNSLRHCYLEALILSERVDGYQIGLSGNYVKVYFNQPVRPNEIVSTRVGEIYLDDIIATTVRQR